MRQFKARARPKQVPGSMNKTEQAYGQHLKTLLMAGEIEHFAFEPVKLRLANKTFYTPDFLVIRGGMMELHEVKGFWEDDARVKIKVAAEQHWMFRFVAVQKAKVGWTTEEF